MKAKTKFFVQFNALAQLQVLAKEQQTSRGEALSQEYVMNQPPG